MGAVGNRVVCHSSGRLAKPEIQLFRQAVQQPAHQHIGIAQLSVDVRARMASL